MKWRTINAAAYVVALLGLLAFIAWLPSPN
jgi:hypothetical protein